MALSPSFSDFTPASSFAHERATASSMSLLPVVNAPDALTPDALTPDSVSRQTAARQTAARQTASRQTATDRKLSATSTPLPPIDRRSSSEGSRAGSAGMERRQFGSSHSGLSDDGRDLASAIDQYKLQHHRRYITCDEMLLVLKSLGYAKPSI